MALSKVSSSGPHSVSFTESPPVSSHLVGVRERGGVRVKARARARVRARVRRLFPPAAAPPRVREPALVKVNLVP